MTTTHLPRKAEDALKHIIGVDLASADLSVCLASSPEDATPQYQRSNFTDSVRVEFENIIRDGRSALASEDRVFRAYDAGSKPDNYEVEYLALSQVPFVEEQLESLQAPLDLVTFSGSDAQFLTDLRFYVVLVQLSRQAPVYWCRGYSKQKELGHSRMFGILMSRGQFDRVSQPLFLFDQYLDCVVSADWIFILKQDGFQKIFRYYDMVKRAAAESLAKIESAIPILNFDGFRQDCEGHLQKLAKLRNIAQKPYLSQITIKDLKKVISHFKLPVVVKRENGKEYLEYNPSDKWAILRLLDDDYLESIMTAQMYEVTGKRVHQPPGP